MLTLKDNKVELNKASFYLLLISSVRYSLGRQTYMVSEVVNLVLTSRNCLTTSQLSQIQREVSKEIEIATASHKFLGMEMDHKNWLRMVNEIHNTIQERTMMRHYAAE